MQALTNYSYGLDCYQEIPDIVHQQGAQKVVLIGGEKALLSVEAEISSILEAADIQLTARLVYGTAATQANIDRLVAQQAVQEADLILAVGGGQAMDTSKMVAKTLGTAMLTIPTICSTCAAGTGLAVIYNDDHSLAYYGSGDVPIHTFLNPKVMVEAPAKYFWAGIGDGISKGPEVTRAFAEDFQRRGLEPHGAILGRAIAQSSLYSLYKYGEEAMQAVRQQQVNQAVQEVMLAIIVSTAYASNLVYQKDFNYASCHAHAFYNGTTIVEREGEYLHGAIVAFGVMVLHAYFEEEEELEAVMAFNQKLGLPLHLGDIGLTEEQIPAIVDYSTHTGEYKHTPYDVAGFAQAIVTAHRLGLKRSQQ